MKISNQKSKIKNPVYRVLDANLNRAREGLRVLEDTARFMWNKPDQFQSLRQARHALDQITRAAYPKLLMARNSHEDMGRCVPEKNKRHQKGLVIANFRRVEEALRVLEEYGKTISPKAAPAFKRIRYQLYTLEKSAGQP